MLLKTFYERTSQKKSIRNFDDYVQVVEVILEAEVSLFTSHTRQGKSRGTNISHMIRAVTNYLTH